MVSASGCVRAAASRWASKAIINTAGTPAANLALAAEMSLRVLAYTFMVI
jgi:hypothetical protein